MRAVVIYESMFGDNQQVAGAIAEGLTEAGVAAEAVEVGRARSSPASWSGPGPGA
jgi:flavorubredoxin